LYVCLLAVIEEPILLASDSLDWVVQKGKSFHHFVGLSYEGFEDELMALFNAIEATRNQNGLASSPCSLSKIVNRGHHELKRLACSLNYDLKGRHYSRGEGKGDGSNLFFMKLTIFFLVE
jgi:hypothetical protein